MYKILIIEDEKNIAELLRHHLLQEGYDCLIAFDGLEGLKLYHANRPDLVVLDLMLPGIGGLDVCKEIRKTSHVPILMLTARKEEVDIVLGLELGADDYLTKPFGLREFLTRVRSALRRVGWDQSDPSDLHDLLRHGDMEINGRTHRVAVGGVDIPFTPAEFQVLYILAREPDVVFTRAELQEKARGQLASDAFDRSIDSIIARIRKKIKDAKDAPDDTEEIINTVWGVGYRFAKR